MDDASEVRCSCGRCGGGEASSLRVEFDGRDGRGVTLQEYKQKKGRVGMMFGGVAAWDVV